MQTTKATPTICSVLRRFTTSNRIGQTALFAFIVPTLDIPIDIPVAVRTGTDYGLRFTVQDITQLTPLAERNMTFWGFPAECEPRIPERFAKGTPGHPAGCAGLANTSCIDRHRPLPRSRFTPHRQPARLHRGSLTTSLEVQTYKDPEHLSKAESSYPAITECEGETFKPVLYASPTTTETDAPSGLNVELSDPLPLGFAASPSEIESATVTLPPGFTINPDAADGQSHVHRSGGQLQLRRPGPLSRQLQDRNLRGRLAEPQRPLEGSVYIGQPEPGNQYRLFVIASGFGINAKLVGSIKPNPQTGQVTAYFENLPQAPFEEFQLHLFSGERALMATPNDLHDLHGQRRLFPLGRFASRTAIEPGLWSRIGPNGEPLPGSDPTLYSDLWLGHPARSQVPSAPSP